MHFAIFLDLQVGSFNYDVTKMTFMDEFISDDKSIRSVLDYFIEIKSLSDKDKMYVALTGESMFGNPTSISHIPQLFAVCSFSIVICRRKKWNWILPYLRLWQVSGGRDNINIHKAKKILVFLLFVWPKIVE